MVRRKASTPLRTNFNTFPQNSGKKKKQKLDSNLQNLLDNCDFFLNISCKEGSLFKIGTFELKVLPVENTHTSSTSANADDDTFQNDTLSLPSTAVASTSDPRVGIISENASSISTSAIEIPQDLSVVSGSATTSCVDSSTYKISPNSTTILNAGNVNSDINSNNASTFPAVFNSDIYLYVSRDSSKCFAYYEDTTDIFKKISYSPVTCLVPYDILSVLRNFKISLSIIKDGGIVVSKDGSLTLQLSVQIGCDLGNVEDLSSVEYSKTCSLQPVLQYFLREKLEEAQKGEEQATWPLHETEIFYDQIRSRQKKICAAELFSQPLNNESLTVSLRLYQAQAVRWMLEREKNASSRDETKELHPLYVKASTLDGKLIYINKYTANVICDKVPYKKPSNPGGILADEMGLGKSIEVLSLVILNPKPELKENTYKFPIVDGSEQLETPFECICGSTELDEEMDNMQCEKCGIWQHGTCLNYDINEYPQAYLCPHCWTDSKTVPYPSKATLIVTPTSISYQWVEEITKHLSKDSLSWYIYEGVRGNNYIQPTSFASYDVVLTTYEVLRKEFYYVDLPHCRAEGKSRLRNPKKFMSLPSPLTAVQWWRVCFDEAQMVESSHSRVTRVALKLSTVNLWCVTGTPIHESIKDIFGLLVLLGEDPFMHQKWWKQLLYDPYCEGYVESLLNVAASCFWRTAKKDVLDQICIPRQKEEIHYLGFSPIEEYFYLSQHEQCCFQTNKNLSKFSDPNLKLKSLDRHSLKVTMAPLLQLRQACCHPQVACRGQYLPLKKKTMTMEELLDSLVKKCKLECEDHHRQLIAATNGLAGINLILGDIKRAAELYREVLQLEKEHSGVIKTDRVQLIHALINLSDILDEHIKPKPLPIKALLDSKGDDSGIRESVEAEPDDFEENPYNIGRTIEDDKLRDRAEELKSTYLNKCKDLAFNTVDVFKKMLETFKEGLSEIKLGEVGAWIFEVLNYSESVKQGDYLIFKVKEHLEEKQTHSSKVSTKFHSVTGLKYILVREMENLESSRKTLSDVIYELSPVPSENDIKEAVDCHLRPDGAFVKCKFCKIHELFNEYEALLYRFKEDTHSVEPSTSEEALFSELRRGIWADSEMEIIIKCIYGLSKYFKCGTEVIEDGATHIKLLESYKKEFRAMRAVWVNITDYISAIDEIEMSKIRMRVRQLDEPVHDPPLPYILEQCEVFSMSVQLASDKKNSQSNLKRKKGRLLYLQNLVNSKFCENGGVNPEKCPVCVKELGTNWSVLQCGHSFCVDCIRIFISFSRGNLTNPTIRCAVCRQTTPTVDINYVNTKPDDSNLDGDQDIKGSYSTKIVGVVKCLLRISKESPRPKVLVFSTWQRVLDILAEALTDNNISYIMATDKNKFQKNIQYFKQDLDKMALLLPIKSGANGLNLIEATHVMFVEPLLNVGDEQQALGRVHRLGQTKTTIFHRFIVKNTIEENIFGILKSNSNSTSKRDDKEMTLKELADLFAVVGKASTGTVE